MIIMREIKKHICLLIFAVTLACGAYDVEGLNLSREGDNTVVKIITSGPTDIKTAQLTGPDRLLIDLIGGIHRLKDEGLPRLPAGIAVDIRTAQNQAKPQPITRIVLVLAEPIGDVRVENGPRSGKVYIPTPGYPEFETWSIGMSAPQEIPEKPEQQAGVQTEPSDTVESLKTDIVDTTPMMPAISDSLSDDSEMIAVVVEDSMGNKASFIRPKVVYEGHLNRDPFYLETENEPSTDFGEEERPWSWSLKLVGIVAGKSGSPLAIMQDNKGWGFIFGVGDSIKDGAVDEITDSTVTFGIVEFGTTRPLTLSLPKEAKSQ